LSPSPEPVVLLIEDEAPMRRFIRASLGAQGLRVLEATNLAEAEIAVTTQNPEVLVLDLGLPDGDGIDFVRRLREWSRVPVIVVSARGREDDKVSALDAGADDYLTKPFGVQELLARIRVALRHAALREAPEPTISVGPLLLDLSRRLVTLEGHEVHLTPIEYRMLVLLAKNLGRVLTHQQILREVWGPAYATHHHYVRVHMAELRKKIERDPARPRLLVTESGVGYRLRDEG
jgi:two-component system KDP operon response regulator KdpE